MEPAPERGRGPDLRLPGRAADLEFLGGPHTGAGRDIDSVRARVLGLAREGYFSSLGYRPEPTDALVKEMDELVERCMDRTRQTLREHAGKVEALVGALLEVEELGPEEVAAILGELPGDEGSESAGGAQDVPSHSEEGASSDATE